MLVKTVEKVLFELGAVELRVDNSNRHVTLRRFAGKNYVISFVHKRRQENGRDCSTAKFLRIKAPYVGYNGNIIYSMMGASLISTAEIKEKVAKATSRFINIRRKGDDV